MVHFQQYGCDFGRKYRMRMLDKLADTTICVQLRRLVAPSVSIASAVADRASWCIVMKRSPWRQSSRWEAHYEG